jgi:hypothetical protein
VLRYASAGTRRAATLGRAIFALHSGREQPTGHAQTLFRQHRRLLVTDIVRFDDSAGRRWRAATSIVLSARMPVRNDVG